MKLQHNLRARIVQRRSQPKETSAKRDITAKTGTPRCAQQSLASHQERASVVNQALLKGQSQRWKLDEWLIEADNLAKWEEGMSAPE
mgnify:CR=1 FL=1